MSVTKGVHKEQKRYSNRRKHYPEVSKNFTVPIVTSKEQA